MCVVGGTGEGLVRGSRRHAGLRIRGGRETVVSGRLNSLLKSSTALRYLPRWASVVFFLSFSFTQSPLLAGLPGDPARKTVSAEGSPSPRGPTQRSEPGGRVSECARRG